VPFAFFLRFPGSFFDHLILSDEEKNGGLPFGRGAFVRDPGP